MWDLTNPQRTMSRTFPLSIRKANAADRGNAPGVNGLPDQTVVQNLEHVRSYRAFERDLGSVDPRSVIELVLVHRLASLLWRLRRAGAIETGLFEIQGPTTNRIPVSQTARTRSLSGPAAVRQPRAAQV